MEREPKPEIKNKARFKCGSSDCNKTHRTEYENTVLFWYEKDKLRTHVRITCEETGFQNIAFVDYEDKGQMEWAWQFSVCDQEDVPEESIMKLWESEFMTEPVKEYETTGSQEKRVEFLGYLLMNMDDSEIQGELSQFMPEQRLPNKWRDD